LFVIPFYILYRIYTDKPCLENPEKNFRYSDIGDELGITLWRIARAPFYALAAMFAIVYGLVDPMNACKLESYIERDWNDDVTRAEGFWSVRGWQALWQFEGGRERGNLGKNGFFAGGCCQPVCVGYFKNHVLQEKGASLSKAVREDKGQTYWVYT